MTKINSTESKILKTVRKYNMISKGDRVLVGLSGGKDSVALLYALRRLSAILGIELVALHVNHGIRGSEADSDEAFSERFCESINVDFASVKIDVPSLSKNSHEGLEAVARNVRYEQFTAFAKQYNCNKIATAHTSSDNSETYLITLLRNGNAKGIPPVRCNVIRPLINLTTSDVLDYCIEMNLSYVTDSTNKDEDYTRNYIRNKIIPPLTKINSSLDECITKDSDIRRSYDALRDIEVEKYYASEENPLSLTSLKKLIGNIAYKNVLFSIIQKEARVKGLSVSYEQFLQIEELIADGTTGRYIELEKGFVAFRDYDALTFKEIEESGKDYKFKIVHGINEIPDSNVVLYLETLEEYKNRQKNNEVKNIKINKLTKNVLIKYNIMDTCLYARSRSAGDAYVSGGMTRKIKKHMINEKIPLSIRSRIPVVCDEEGIIWVPGLGLADRLKNQEGELLSLSVDFKI